MPDVDIVLKLLTRATDADDHREVESLEELGILLGLGRDDVDAIRTSGEALDAVLKKKIPNGTLPNGIRVMNVLTLFSDSPATRTATNSTAANDQGDAESDSGSNPATIQ